MTLNTKKKNTRISVILLPFASPLLREDYSGELPPLIAILSTR
jgi:hypothetical protein